MFKPLLAILLAFFLIAANFSHRDGYRFSDRQYKLDTVEITLVEHENQRELLREFNRQNTGPRIDSNRELKSFAMLDPANARCTIHIIRPERRYTPQWLGHETYHCFYGQFHGNNNSNGY